EPTQQLERLMQRDGLSKSNAKARISTNAAMSRKEHSQTGYFQTRKINSQHYITQKAFQETKQQKS
ncbi:MAG: hypothetical protein ACO270_13855, partial [Burkholderiaceae bacterium]